MKSINNPDLRIRCGRYCSALRKYNGYTAKQVAKACNVSLNTVQNFERGYTKDSGLLIYYMSMEGFKIKSFLLTLSLSQFCEEIKNGEE